MPEERLRSLANSLLCRLLAEMAVLASVVSLPCPVNFAHHRLRGNRQVILFPLTFLTLKSLIQFKPFFCVCTFKVQANRWKSVMMVTKNKNWQCEEVWVATTLINPGVLMGYTSDHGGGLWLSSVSISQVTSEAMQQRRQVQTVKDAHKTWHPSAVTSSSSWK